MVQLGLTLAEVGTALDLEEGLAFLTTECRNGVPAWRSSLIPVPAKQSDEVSKRGNVGRTKMTEKNEEIRVP